MDVQDFHSAGSVPVTDDKETSLRKINLVNESHKRKRERDLTKIVSACKRLTKKRWKVNYKFLREDILAHSMGRDPTNEL